MQNTIRMLTACSIALAAGSSSSFLQAQTAPPVYEEMNKMIEQIGYVGKGVDNVDHNAAFVILKQPDVRQEPDPNDPETMVTVPDETSECYYGIIHFSPTSSEGKILYNTLLAAKLSEQPVWVTFTKDSTGDCVLTGARAAG